MCNGIVPSPFLVRSSVRNHIVGKLVFRQHLGEFCNSCVFLGKGAMVSILNLLKARVLFSVPMRIHEAPSSLRLRGAILSHRISTPFERNDIRTILWPCIMDLVTALASY